MGSARYRGPVHTLAQALLADMPVRVTCAECGHVRQMHAFALTEKTARHPKLRTLNLWEPVAGFRCGRCGRSVRAVVTAPLEEAW